MGLDLAVLTPASAENVEAALDVYYERRPGAPDEGELDALVEELGATYGDDESPFTGDPLVLSGHARLSFAWESWEQEVPRIVEAAHRHGLVVLDPQEERIYPPEDFAVS